MLPILMIRPACFIAWCRSQLINSLSYLGLAIHRTWCGKRCCQLLTRQLSPLSLLSGGHLDLDFGPKSVEVDVVGLKGKAKQQCFLRLIQASELNQRPASVDTREREREGESVNV